MIENKKNKLNTLVFNTLVFNTLIYNTVFSAYAINDAPHYNQISFQDPASPIMEGIIFLHDYVWNYLVFILIFVSWMLFRILVLFKEDDNKGIVPVTQNVNLEIVWTSLPAILLALIGSASISHLYSAEEAVFPTIDIIIIGSQWYWAYEFIVFTKKVSFESHMIDTEDLFLGECRNLEVDNPLILPTETNIRALVTSTDVLHSWTVPSLGVKIDAVPGRINEGKIYISRPGIYYGQCSEICGKGHSVMPIKVIAVPRDEYNVYLHFVNLRDRNGKGF